MALRKRNARAPSNESFAEASIYRGLKGITMMGAVTGNLIANLDLPKVVLAV